jgi:hypothetical protein
MSENKQITIEGYTDEELLNLPEEQIDTFVLCKEPIAFRIGSGNDNGRVYTITFKVVDASGNVATATARVTVPKSQNGAVAIDDGPHYTVLSGCP